MYYAQFYHIALSSNHQLVEACGDRAVIILDGREGLATHRKIAKTECNKREFDGFSIHKGETFSRSTLIDGPRLSDGTLA